MPAHCEQLDWEQATSRVPRAAGRKKGGREEQEHSMAKSPKKLKEHGKDQRDAVRAPVLCRKARLTQPDAEPDHTKPRLSRCFRLGFRVCLGLHVCQLSHHNTKRDSWGRSNQFSGHETCPLLSNTASPLAFVSTYIRPGFLRFVTPKTLRGRHPGPLSLRHQIRSLLPSPFVTPFFHFSPFRQRPLFSQWNP